MPRRTASSTHSRSSACRLRPLKDFLGHELSSIDPTELQLLRSTYSAIKDGETTWKAVMDDKAEKEAEAKAAGIRIRPEEGRASSPEGAGPQRQPREEGRRIQEPARPGTRA